MSSLDHEISPVQAKDVNLTATGLPAEKLDIDRLRNALRSHYAVITYVSETDSTNTQLMNATDAADGTVLLTDLQTSGKGRLGRAWSTPAGTQLTFSVLLHVKDLDNIGTLPLAAGLAVTDAIPGTVLKWPNDVLLDGKKLCGILAEAAPIGKAFTSSSPNRGSTPVARVVLGVGINVSLSAEDLPVPTATSLLLAGRETDRTQVGIDVLTALRQRMTQWENNDPQLMAGYRQVCSSIGMRVRLEAPGGNVIGRVEDVADDGRINVAGQYYSAGDVIHLRPAQAPASDA